MEQALGEPDSKRRRCDEPMLDENADEENSDFEDMDMEEDMVEMDAAMNEDMAVQPQSLTTQTQGGPMNLNYSVVSPGEIHQMMCCIVNDVHKLIPNVSPSTLRTMLNHAKWVQEQFLTNYYDDPNEFMKQAQVHERADIGEVHEPPGPAAVGRCEICFDTVPVEGQFSMNCGHKFCDQCWQKYLLFKIMEEGDSQYITCPGCNIIVEDWLVEKYVTDQGVLDKYKHLICQNFVLSNKRMRWCPNAGCSNAIWAEVMLWAPVSCACGHEFCFSCGLEWHAPLRCDLLQMWNTKQADDGGNCQWIHQNTKNCPSCNTIIEKNGGCNHMTCRNKSCGHEFCWICGHDWKTHVGNAYNCNRYNHASEQETASGTSRASIQRFAHYSMRHANHTRSLKYEAGQTENIVRMSELYMVQHGMTFADVQFLLQGHGVLLQCRKALIYTYPFAFYLNTSNKSVIFEANQRDLERETENLSEFLEIHLYGSKYTPAEMKANITDKLTYCEQRRLVLLDCIYEGYGDGSWSFTSN